MEQNNFLFYKSYYESIKKVPSENEQLELFLGICSYVFDNKTPELSFIPDLIFTQIKANIDSGIKKREDGAKGGRPKKTMVIENKNHGYQEEKPTFFEEKTYEKPIEENRKEKNRKEVEENTKEKDKKEIANAIVDLYHQCCPSLPKVSRLNATRERLINARLKEYTIDELKEIFIKAENSDLLKFGFKDWKGADFDFILAPSKIAKIAEGAYDNREDPKQEPEETREAVGYILNEDKIMVPCYDREELERYKRERDGK